MNRFVLAIILALSLAACSDPNGAARVLDGAGYTEVTFTGHSWFSCSEDDTYSTGFVAKGPTGKPVKGAVCAGLFFKNATIRLE